MPYYDSHFNDVDPIPPSNLYIKPPFATAEEIQKFKDLGGKVETVPYGECSGTVSQHDFTKTKPTKKYGRYNKNFESSQKKNKTENLSYKSPKMDVNETVKIIDKPPSKIKPSAQEIAAAIFSSRQKDKSESPKNKTTVDKSPRKKAGPKKNRSANPWSPAEIDRLKTIALNREAAIKDGLKTHMGVCNTHNFTVFTIFDNNRRSRCKICRSSRRTQNGLVEPNPVEAKRIADIIKSRREAIAAGEKTFFAECLTHKYTEYAIIGNSSRCILCRSEQQKSSRAKRMQLSDDGTNQLIENSARLERNAEACRVAKEKGELVFIGECILHNIAPMTIEKRPNKDNRTNESYRCLECRKISQFISNQTRKLKT